MRLSMKWDFKIMTREEQIIKQADIYAEWSNDGGLSVANNMELVKKAFIEGAKWADNNYISSLWNDSNIVPYSNKGILYLTKNDKIGVIKAIKSDNWDWYVNDKYSIVKWAYIDDILPNSEQLKGDEKLQNKC